MPTSAGHNLRPRNTGPKPSGKQPSNSQPVPSPQDPSNSNRFAALTPSPDPVVLTQDATTNVASTRNPPQVNLPDQTNAEILQALLDLRSTMQTINSRVSSLESQPQSENFKEISQKVQDNTQNLTDLRNDTTDHTNGLDENIEVINEEITKLSDQISTDLNNVNSGIANLRTDINKIKKPADANHPVVTPIPNIVTPQNISYQLASKTVNVKTLCKQLESCSFPRDDPQSIHMSYMKISQAIDMACGTSSLLPSIDSVTKVPDFYPKLVPSDINHRFRNSIHNSYKAISSCLFNFLMSDSAIGEKANIAKSARNELATNLDGFHHLALILHRTLPQFGGPSINLMQELAKMKVVDNETLPEFHSRATKILNTIKFSKITISKTIFFETYLNELKTVPAILPFLSEYIRKFQMHKRLLGDNVLFDITHIDLYQTLLDMGCPTTLKASSDSLFNPSASKASIHPPWMHVVYLTKEVQTSAFAED